MIKLMIEMVAIIYIIVSICAIFTIEKDVKAIKKMLEEKDK